MPKRIAGVTASDVETLAYALQLLRRKGWYPLYASMSGYHPEAGFYIQLPDQERTLICGDSGTVFARIAALPQKEA